MSILTFLGLATLQCTALMVAGLVAVKALRKHSAAFRHSILMTCMILALACPLCTSSLPELQVLPLSNAALANNANPVLMGPQAEVSLRQNDVLQMFGADADQPLLNEVAGNDEIQDKQDHANSVDSLPAAEISDDAFNADIGRWCVMFWTLGTLLLLSRILLSLLFLRYLERLGQTDTSLESLAKRPNVRFLTSDIAKTPLSFGVVTPCVIVPKSLVVKDIDQEQLNGILLHELAHIDRSDAIWQWVVLLAQSLHWFNPLIWIVSRKIELEREVACDDRVIRAGITPRRYAQALVDALPKSFRTPTQCLALSLSSTFEIKTRIRSIMSRTKNRSGSSLHFLVVGAMTIGFTIVGLSIVRAREPITMPQEDANLQIGTSDAPNALPPQKQQITQTPYRNADFVRAKIARAAGRKAFIQADFSRARLTNAILSGGDDGFQRATFERASASGALLLGGDGAFQGTSFSNARLKGTVFSAGHDSFHRAVFDGADLEQATFRCSPNALRDMSVSDTNFDMADLSQVSPDVLRSWNFVASMPPRYTSLTVFPDRFSAEANGWTEITATVEDENAMEIAVTDENGRAISNVRVFQNHVYKPSVPDGRPTRIKNYLYTTDERGKTSITWQGESVDLRIWVYKEGFQPQHAMWAVDIQPDDHTIPAEFSMQLPRGATIGGIVKDENGNPVEGAFVEIQNHSVFDTFGATDRPVPSNWVAEGSGALRTDSEGRWRSANAPVQDVSLQIRVSHAQFATNEGTGEDKHSLDALRNESAITVLQSRSVVRENAYP